MTFIRIYIQTLHALATEMVDIYHLHGMLGAIDSEINRLDIQMQRIINKLSRAEECSAVLAKAEQFAGILANTSVIIDPTASLYQANNVIQPWRHTMPQKYFVNLHRVWPEGLPSNWTPENAADFFALLYSALERDVAAIEGITALALGVSNLNISL